MPSKSFPVQAQLDLWREQGADRIDPLRFSLIAGLAQRAAHHDGHVAQLLQQRLAQLRDDYARAVAAALPVNAVPVTGRAATTPLRGLLEHIGNAASPTLPASATPLPAASAIDTTEPAATQLLEPLAVLDEFQQLWGRIRIDSLLRQSLESISEDAGPLHSSVLLHRAMTLMRDISPEYLQHFLAYSDALSWMEQLTAGASSSSDTGRSATGRKAARVSGPRRKK
jgi:hypothetical protein